MLSHENVTERTGISIVIPVYRSKSILPILIERIEATLQKTDADYEVVLVNDCSPDRSWKVIFELAAKTS